MDEGTAISGEHDPDELTDFEFAMGKILMFTTFFLAGLWEATKFLMFLLR